MASMSPTTPSLYASYQLLCIGHPLLDIQVRDNAEKLLEKYKLKEDDGILAGEEQEGIYEEITAHHKPTRVAGGAAQNTARGAAYILPPRTVAYTGSVGDDDFAEYLRAANRREEVLDLCQVIEGVKTGACAVIITGSNRSLVTNLRAAKDLEESHFSTPKLASVIANIKILYMEGFMLTHNPEIVIRLAERVHEQGKLVVVNLSAPYIPRLHNSAIQKISPYCGIILANEAEALSWAQSNGVPLTNSHRDNDTDIDVNTYIPQIAKAIALQPKAKSTLPPNQTLPTVNGRIVIITSGSHSTTVVLSSSPDEPRIYPVPPLKPTELVDTNAAGDAFAGGFLGAYLLHHNSDLNGQSLKWLDDCVEVGHRLAGMCCGQVGGQYRWPKVDVLKDLNFGLSSSRE